MALGPLEPPVVPLERLARRVPLGRRARLDPRDPLERLEQRGRRVQLEALDPLERLGRQARREPLGRLERLGPRDPPESLIAARLLGHCVLATGGRFKMKAPLLCSATTASPAKITAMQCSLAATTGTSRQD